MIKILVPVLLAAVAATALVPHLDEVASTPAAAPERAAAAVADAPLRKQSGIGLGDVVIKADAQGQFRVDARVGGTPVRFLADTGATLVALRESEARRIGIHVSPADYSVRVETANGLVDGAKVRVPEILVGSVRVGPVDGLVLPDAALGTNLLGMSFLRALKGFQVAGDRLILSN